MSIDGEKTGSKLKVAEPEIIPPLVDEPDPELHLYQYEPLPSATSIRVLELLPSEAGKVRCLLVTVDLEDRPLFDALSYTWGDPVTIHKRPDEETQMAKVTEIITGSSRTSTEGGPKTSVFLDMDAMRYRLKHPFVPYEEVNWRAERCYPVECNGNAAFVTENLFEALQLFCRLVVGDAAIPADFFERLGINPRLRYLWIDAICINQEDTLERNAQIAIIGRVFGEARNVFSWLRRTDSFSKLGFHTLSRLCEHISKDQDLMTRFSGSFYNSDGIDEAEWLAVFAVLQRLWFRRAWIMQEVIFAKQLVIICGSTFVRWAALEEAVIFMAKIKLDDKIHKMVTAIMRGGPISKLARDVQKAGLLSAGFATPQPLALEKLVVNPKASYHLVAGIRRIKMSLGLPLEVAYFQHEKDELEQKEPGNWTPSGMGFTVVEPAKMLPVTLLDLLCTFRGCDASDPRDKVIAFLGIASSAAIMKPDYRLSVQEVYIRASESILRSAGKLTILSHIQDPSLTRVQGLPSWVPDFSVDPGRSAFEDERPGNWSASGETGSPQFAITSQNLVLDGLLIDTILDMASSKGCYFVRTAKIALGTPAWYLNHRPGLIGYRPEFVNTDREPVVFPIPENSIRPRIRRVEALWRTLTADCIEEKHPAPIRYGFGFSDWVCLKINRALDLDSIISRSRSNIDGIEYGNAKDAETKLAEKLGVWNSLDNDEMGGYYSLEELAKAKEGLSQRSNELGKIGPLITQGDGISLEAGGLRFLADRERLDSFVSTAPDSGLSRVLYENASPLNSFEQAQLTAFEARIKEVKAVRHMFRTAKYYLGMGPRSIEVGDMVWLLRGANVPFILRPSRNGKFKIVGEAYVHGIMHGEALTGAAEFQTVTLE